MCITDVALCSPCFTVTRWEFPAFQWFTWLGWDDPTACRKFLLTLGISSRRGHQRGTSKPAASMAWSGADQQLNIRNLQFRQPLDGQKMSERWCFRDFPWGLSPQWPQWGSMKSDTSLKLEHPNPKNGQSRITTCVWNRQIDITVLEDVNAVIDIYLNFQSFSGIFQVSNFLFRGCCN